MEDIAIPAAWFYIILGLLFILIVIIAFLLVLLCRMKSGMYKHLKESNDLTFRSRTTTINSNRYNIQLDCRKDSDRLLQIYNNFNNDESFPRHTNNTAEKNAQTQKTTESNDHVDNDKGPEIKPQQEQLPAELFLRKQLGEITKELLSTRFKLKTQDKAENVGESYELRDLNAIKKRIKSFRVSTQVRSKSTTDLDIYDVLTEPNRVLRFNTPAKEDEKYTSVRNDRVIIVNDESGYQLPLSVHTPYVNSNVK